MAERFAYVSEDELCEKCVIKQLLNSVFAWYHELWKPRVCVIYLSLRQITQTWDFIILSCSTSSNNWLIFISLQSVLGTTLPRATCGPVKVYILMTTNVRRQEIINRKAIDSKKIIESVTICLGTQYIIIPNCSHYFFS